MKTQLKSIFAILSLTGLIVLPAIAKPVKENKAHLKQVSAQNKALESELSEMGDDVHTLKSHPHGSKTSHKKQHLAKRKMMADDPDGYRSSDESRADEASRLTGKDLLTLMSEQQNYLPFDFDVPGQSFVSTGPYIGVPIQYSGSNLIINSPSVNTDVQLLGIRDHIHKQLNAVGGHLQQPYHSHLLLSGIVETQASYYNYSGPNNGGFPVTDIDLTNVSLDFFVLGPSDWTLGFVELSYENGPLLNNLLQVTNSRVFVNKAFVTIGNFACSPFYTSFGQFYVPFGRYSSMMVSDPLTKTFARTKARAIVVGYQELGDNAFYGSTYIFRGGSHATAVSKVNNGGINLGFNFRRGSFGGDIGVGVIANVADSLGLQLGNSFRFYEQIIHRVPAYNARAIFSLGEHLSFIGEYIQASNHFDYRDMSVNGRGAHPWAFDTQLGYSFYILDDRPSTIAVGFGKTHDLLGLALPLNRTSLVFNTSLWRNTLQSLEFKGERNYSASTVVNGSLGAIPRVGGPCTAAICAGSGQFNKAVTASFDYFF